MCVLCAEAPAPNSRDIFGWPPAVLSYDPSCQLSVIMPVSVNGDPSLSYADQSVPCVAAGNYSSNQQQVYNAGYVQQMPAELAEPSPPQGQPQLIAGSVSALSSVQRVARPILGASANLGLPHATLDKTAVANIPSDSSSGKGVVGAIVPMTVDVIPGSVARPPSSSENIPNGRHWPLAQDSPNGVLSVAGPPPSSSPVMMQQPPAPPPADTVTGNLSHPFVTPPYCFITPGAIPSTTVPTVPSTSGSTAVAPAAGNPAPAANLCAAGYCHCGQCQPAAPPVGAYTYAYPPFMFPNAAPFLPGFGYALPGLPFPPPSLPPVSYSGTYTQSTDVVYNNQPVFSFMHQFQRPPPPPAAQAAVPPPPPPTTGRGHPVKPSSVVTVPFNPMMPPPPPSAHAANPSGRRNVLKNMSCFNCGLIGHHANMCLEPLISSSAHTGTSVHLHDYHTAVCILCISLHHYITQNGQNLQRTSSDLNIKLECGPVLNVMVALPNIGAALCSTPQFG